MISLSPLSSAHPSCFQPTLVRTSTWCYPGFILAKDRSTRFTSEYHPLERPVQTRFRYGCAALYGLTLRVTFTSRIIMQKARGQTRSPPTACKHTVSGSISLPLQGFFSPFPHGTGSLSVACEYLALGDGSPRFMQDSSCPALLGYQSGVREVFAYAPLTLFGTFFQTTSANFRIGNSTLTGPTTPRGMPLGLG